MSERIKSNPTEAGRMKWTVPACGIILALFSVNIFFGRDAGYVLRWYAGCLVPAVAALPLCFAIFPGFADRGFAFARPLGLMLSGGLLWALSVFHIMPVNRLTAFVCAAACFAVFTAFCLSREYKNNNNKNNIIKSGLDGIRDSARETLPDILWEELLFVILLLYWAHLKGSDPAAYGTEKFMDYGFMMAMDKSPYSPAMDIWFAGEGINYYYVGQFLAVVMTKFAGIPVAYSYNLMMMTLPAIGFLECFGIARRLLDSFMGNMKKSGGKSGVRNQTDARRIPLIGGVTAGLACTFAGNVHYVIYGLFGAPSATGNAYYYPDSTRFIGYNPDIPDKTIHEYPSYSFIISDLHAHVMNYIFVLTVVALLLTWTLKREARMEAAGNRVSGANLLDISNREPIYLILLRAVFCPEVILIGIFIGMFLGINYWDFPIYYVVSGAVILIMNARIYRDFRKVICVTAAQGIFIMALVWLVSYPFRSNFDMMASHVYLTDRHTSLYQLTVLWGLPIAVICSFIGARFTDSIFPGGGSDEKSGKSGKSNPSGPSGGADNSSVFARLSRTPVGQALSRFVRRVELMRTEDVFMITIALCAMGLVFMPEVVYVKDIYGDAYQRTNTMFKLTYQAYILFTLCFGYMLPRLIASETRTGFRRAGLICAVLLFLTLGFFVNAARTRFGGVLGHGYETLDASAFMMKQYQDDDFSVNMLDDKAAIDWLNENVKEYPVVILEADSESYTFGNRISVFTGQPTALGWRVHEWLWRSDPDNPSNYPASVAERDGDVKNIYTSREPELVRDLLEKYHIDYIIFGYRERHNGVWADSYGDDPGDEEEFLKSLGDVVFESASNPDEPLYIIRVNRE